MAGLYAAGKAQILLQGCNYVYALRAVPVTSLYSPDLVAHTSLLDIPGAARAAPGELLTGVAATPYMGAQARAALNADDLTILAVPSGDPIVALVLYLDTGAEGSSTLVAYLDYFANLPLTPDGRDVVFTWPDDDNKIFSW